MVRLICFLSIFMVVISCQPDPEKLLERARDHLEQHAFVSYAHMALWPNMINEIDTIAGVTKFRKNKNTYFEYDYIGLRDIADMTYINNDFKVITHEDSIVTVYSEEDIEKNKRLIEQSMFITFSPISFMKQTGWKFKPDAPGNSKRYNYFLVETDTVSEGKNIYVENHIFINPKTLLLEQYERRAFVNGEKSQFITYYFTDYELRKDVIDFVYELPEGYITQIAGKKEKIRPLAEGTNAPGFENTDMSGKPVNLSSFTGQKVLLNFSIINCGWCKTALDHFNREDFKLSEDIHVLYINPVDSKAQVEKYIEKFHVPFPVIAEAKAVGESYRVNGYPTFYLIDKDGKIEKVQSGYHKDFINSLGR